MYVNQNAICVYLYNNTPCNASVNATDVFAVLFMNELKNLTNVVIGKLGKLIQEQNCSHDFLFIW